VEVSLLKSTELPLHTGTWSRGRRFGKVRDKGHNEPNKFLWKSFSYFKRKLRFHTRDPTREEDFLLERRRRFFCCRLTSSIVNCSSEFSGVEAALEAFGLVTPGTRGGTDGLVIAAIPHPITTAAAIHTTIPPAIRPISRLGSILQCAGNIICVPCVLCVPQPEELHLHFPQGSS